MGTSSCPTAGTSMTKGKEIRHEGSLAAADRPLPPEGHRCRFLTTDIPRKKLNCLYAFACGSARLVVDLQVRFDVLFLRVSTILSNGAREPLLYAERARAISMFHKM